MSNKRKISYNSKKYNNGYNKNNQYNTRDKYFFTNSMNTEIDGSLAMYYTIGNETKFITISDAMKILKGPNTTTKQDIVNKLSDYFYNCNGIYSSMIEKCVGIMTFDRVITRGKSKITKDKYIEALRIINEKYVRRNFLLSVDYNKKELAEELYKVIKKKYKVSKYEYLQYLSSRSIVLKVFIDILRFIKKLLINWNLLG